MTKNVPFRILATNYGTKPHRLPKVKMAGHLTPHSGLLILTKVGLWDIIGIERTIDVKDLTNHFSSGEEYLLRLQMAPQIIPLHGRRRRLIN